MKVPPIAHFQVVETQNASIPWLSEDPFRSNEGSNTVHADVQRYYSAWILAQMVSFAAYEKTG